jgi:hypothetical protein
VQDIVGADLKEKIAGKEIILVAAALNHESTAPPKPSRMSVGERP